MRSFALFLAAVLLIGLGVQAGTADDPEFTDPEGDQDLSDGGFTGLDITSGWVQHTDTDLVLMLQVAGNAAPGATTQYEWHFHGEIDGEGFTASLTGLNDGGYETGGDASSAEVNGGLITFTVPRADVGAADGTTVTGIFAEGQGYGAHGGPPELSNDRAPDDGFGRDYLIEAPAAEEPEVAYFDSTEEVLTVAGDFSQAQDSTSIYNWTGPENVTLQLDVAGSGNVSVEILDPTGGGQFDCVCTGERNETLHFRSEAGGWQVRVAYEAFTGSLSLRMEETAQGDVPDDEDGDGAPGGDGDSTGNATDDGGEESPLPLFVLLVALMVAAVRARR